MNVTDLQHIRQSTPLTTGGSQPDRVNHLDGGFHHAVQCAPELYLRAPNPASVPGLLAQLARQLQPMAGALRVRAAGGRRLARRQRVAHLRLRGALA